MDTYFFTVIVLLGLAIFDLTVGVSNDAVNFMNSAIGSKAASRKVIVVIAAMGIFAGVLFSSDMMEVARKGIFNPQFFILSELLVIFMAVMLQDILLLDTYNTFGLPTSTTVSVVFGLFGGALAISLIKVLDAGQPLEQVFEYINTTKVTIIIGAIFLSIFIAFIVGAFTQFITRMIFTFDFKKKFKRYGALWGGIALTAIIYFILLKGAKGSPFIAKETIKWINAHTGIVVLINFGFWAVILQLLTWFTKVNILKVIVLIGTFALAMAFAANDLVNFIGAPIAGFEAYSLAEKAGDFGISMGGLSKKIPANILFLVISGLIMSITLFMSKKARTVTKTEVSLGRQDEGFERFESHAFARMLVRMVISINKFFSAIVPQSVREKVNKRFDNTKFIPEKGADGDKQAFDLVRASVNLMVASTLIAIATSMKLPLSTTYVTFIVAMATALPDRAWGRESAVYRVSGVLTVIGGWFFTAISASIVAGLIATILFFGKFTAIVGMVLFTSFIVYRSSKIHKRRAKEQEEAEAKEDVLLDTPNKALEHAFNNVNSFFSMTNKTLTLSFNGMFEKDLSKLKKARKQAKKLQKESNALVTDVLKVLRYADDDEMENGHVYAKPLGALHEMSERLRSMTVDNAKYFNNNHEPLLDEQVEELRNYNVAFSGFMDAASLTIKDKYTNRGDSEIEANFKVRKDSFKDIQKKNNKSQFKRIKKSLANKRRSILYLNILEDANSIADNTVMIVESYEQFYKMLHKD